MSFSVSDTIVTVGQVLAYVSWCFCLIAPVDPPGVMMFWCITLAGLYLLVSLKKGKGIRTRIFIGTALLFVVPPALENIAIHSAWLPALPHGLALCIPTFLGLALFIHWLRTGCRGAKNAFRG